MILEKLGPVAYHLAFPSSLSRMHNVFHVSILRHYISDPSHVINLSNLQISDDGVLKAELIHILDQRTRQLRRRSVDQVKVRWDSYSSNLAIWKYPSEMHH